MIEEIKSKLNNNINCDLNVEELKILYAMDNDIDYQLFEYIVRRVNYYEDCCKIFGSEHVASNPKEITENTICYSSLLIINDKLPTYNLKYAYSISYDINDKLPTYNLKYAYSISYDIADYYDGHIYNLENLEIVYNHFMILAPYFYESEFPQNLQKVFKNLYLKFNYYDYLDLSNIDYLKRLQLDIKNINFENIILPNKLDCLFISNYIDSKDIPHNINELILNRCIVKDNYLKLSSTIEKVSFINMKINQIYRYKEILPKNINIYVGGIKQSYDDIFGSKKLII